MSSSPQPSSSPPACLGPRVIGGSEETPVAPRPSPTGPIRIDLPLGTPLGNMDWDELAVACARFMAIGGVGGHFQPVPEQGRLLFLPSTPGPGPGGIVADPAPAVTAAPGPRGPESAGASRADGISAEDIGAWRNRQAQSPPGGFAGRGESSSTQPSSPVRPLRTGPSGPGPGGAIADVAGEGAGAPGVRRSRQAQSPPGGIEGRGGSSPAPPSLSERPLRTGPSDDRLPRRRAEWGAPAGGRLSGPRGRRQRRPPSR